MIEIAACQAAHLPGAIAIWNEVVEAGQAFPQLEALDMESGRAFFAAQSFTGIAVDSVSGAVCGLYILHPNNVGRCGHICNASYAVATAARGQGVGELLVRHSMDEGRRLGFRILQFNAVVCTNHPALRLYEKLGVRPFGRHTGRLFGPGWRVSRHHPSLSRAVADRL